MRVRDLVPEGVKEHIRLIRMRLRYPGRTVNTSRIGSGVEIGKACRIATGVQLGAGVRIGDYSYVNDGTLIGCGSVGRFCSIGYYVNIGMHEHPIDFLSTSPFTYGARNIFGVPSAWNDFHAPPTVENDVWIGSHATILQGTRIGHGAIVAAGAVVTKDVPPYAIVGGVPAKIIRYRFEPEVVRQLLAFAWWDRPTEDLMRRAHLFQSHRSRSESLPPDCA